MKKRLFLLPFMFFALAVSAFAQRNLEIKDVTAGLNVFSGKDTEAGLIITCPTNIPLTFESSHDKVVDVYNKELKGEDTYYYLRFQTGKKYRGRKLTIITNEYAPLSIVVELTPKELKKYQVLDPDVEFVYGCYYEYRKRGTEYFQQAMYNEAKEQYSIAKECSDRPDNANLDELIANIDSIQSYLKRGDSAFELMDYTTASEYYTRVLVLNPSDANASEKRFSSSRLYDSDCKRYFDTAEVYKEDGEYDKALELYRKVIDLNCSSALVASEEAKKIELLLQSRKQKAHVLTAETATSGVWGFSTGKYRNRKVGGYFSLNANYHLIEAAQQEPEKCGIGRIMEAGMSFGWTFCPVPKYPYVWLFFGPGYTGAGQYLPKPLEVDDEEDEDDDDDKYKFRWYNSFSPEIGALIKVGPIALRYTFQYRLAFDDSSKDLFENNKTRHMLGFGICF
jgi:tetratricopeptide (TPR) repeat protein